MISGDSLDIILRVQNLRRFQAQMRQAAASVDSVGAATRRASASGIAWERRLAAQQASLLAVRRAAKWTGAAVAVAGLEAYKMAISFDREMELVHTQAGASQAEVGKLRKAVLDMAGEVPQGPQELAKGLFHLESIGIRGKAAIDALRVAAEGAAVGQADLESTTTALGSAWLANIKGVGDFKNTMSIMNATVGAGNMRMDELVTSLGTGILPAAKVAGIGVYDIMGALALLKDEGWGAYGSMAQLATALHFLYAPTKKAEDAMAEMGLGALDLNRMLAGPSGLPGTLTLLDEKLRQFSHGDMAIYRRELAKILPGGRGRVMLILMNQLDRYGMKLKQIKKTQENYDESVDKTMEQPVVKLQKAWSKLQAGMIEFGDTLKDTLTPVFIALFAVLGWVIGALADTFGWIGDLKGAFEDLPAPIQAIIAIIGIMMAELALWWVGTKVIALATILWYALAGAVETAAIAMLILLDHPVLLAIAAIIAALAYMITHWKQVKQAASDAWNWIKDHWQMVAIFLSGPLAPLTAMIILLISLIKHAKDAAHWIGEIPKKLDFIPNPGGGLDDVMKDWNRNLGNRSLGVANQAFGGFHHLIPHPAGSGFRGPDIARIPRGAMHSNAPAPQGPFGDIDRQPVILHSRLEVSKKVLAEAVSEHIIDKKARR